MCGCVGWWERKKGRKEEKAIRWKKKKRERGKKEGDRMSLGRKAEKEEAKRERSQFLLHKELPIAFFNWRAPPRLAPFYKGGPTEA